MATFHVKLCYRRKLAGNWTLILIQFYSLYMHERENDRSTDRDAVNVLAQAAIDPCLQSGKIAGTPCERKQRSMIRVVDV